MDVIVKVIDYISKMLPSTYDSDNSAEWLYEKGRRDALYDLLRRVERLGNEQQK